MNYKVYEGTTLKTTVSTRSATITGLTPLTSYTFGVTPNNGLRDGDQKTITVKTRGIRFNIPKTLTVGSTITLRYEEYPLGTVPIGNEPSGMFGGGNKQNLSAKVISTANGNSVVEVGGNVIEVGGRNLLTGTGYHTITGTNTNGYLSNETTSDLQTLFNGLEGQTVTISVDYKYSGYISGSFNNRLGWEVSIGTDTTVWNGAWYYPNNDSGSGRTSQTFVIPKNMSSVGEGMGYIQFSGSGTGTLNHLKLEKGSIATPYASFVDGDTFTAQPDGTYALISEYKALYY